MSQVTSPKLLYPLQSFIHAILEFLHSMILFHGIPRAKDTTQNHKVLWWPFFFIYQHCIFHSCAWVHPPSKIPTVLD